MAEVLSVALIQVLFSKWIRTLSGAYFEIMFGCKKTNLKSSLSFSSVCMTFH